VLVIAGSDTGSGFFVTPDTIITNHHVIEKSTTPKVIVVGRGTDGPRLARVAAKVTGKGAHARDYAILKVEGTPSSVILPLTTVVNELDSVVAAGFPGLLLDNDLNYRALAGGDMSALPNLALSQGSIMARQNRDRGLATLAHSAAISGGNSGGPLVDTCGRVVGINTFINVSVEQGTNAGFALAATDIMSYLKEVGVPFTRSDTPCQ
jgi:S1-C subfamily serine protease